jgi:hypothetical protein
MEVEGYDVGLRHPSPGHGFTAVAGARTTECGLFFLFGMDFLAAFGLVIVIVLFMLQLFLPAAAGMVGAPFG